MSTVSSMRSAIHSALGAISALSTVQRYDALRTDDALDVAKRRPALVVVYLGRRKADGPLAQRNRNTMRYRWAIVAVCDNWRSPIGAVDDFLSLSDALDDLRLAELTTVNDDPVYLRFLDEQIVGPPDRPADAGPAMLITNWESTEVLA